MHDLRQFVHRDEFVVHRSTLKAYTTWCYRNNKRFANDTLNEFVLQRLESDCASLKTNAAKQRAKNNTKSLIDFLNKNKRAFSSLWLVMHQLVELKKCMLHKVDDAFELRPFLWSGKCALPFKHEGLVIRTLSSTIKVVDRGLFSLINSSAQTIRGWNGAITV